jgi:hypothetical protein
MKPKLLIQTFLSFALTASLFVPIVHAETSWTEWPDNPILSRDAAVDYPAVLYDPDRFSGHGDAVTYKMWSDQDLQYFTSDNGIEWNFVKDTAGGLAGPVGHPVVEYYPDGFDAVKLGDPPFDDKMFYRLWYWNESYLTGIDAIYYAESPDGVTWYNNQPISQDPDAPLIVTGNTDDWNAGSYGPADVLYNPKARNRGTDWAFSMYYDGTDLGDESLGIAFSKDGIHWIGHDTDGDGKADPILVGGGPDDWDGGAKGYVSRATVIKIKKRYHMWYSGGETDMNDGIGYAGSRDGIGWVKSSANPIFHISDGVPWRTERTYTPLVIYDPDAFCGSGHAFYYKMWFSGRAVDKTVGYAVGGEPSRDCFDIHHAMVLRPKGKRNKQVFVLQAIFWAEIPDKEEDRVVFALNGQELVNVEFVRFANSRNGYVYRSPKQEKPSVKMTLNFDKGTWHLAVKDVDLYDLGREIEYRLEVGAFIGSLGLKMREKKNGFYYLKEE